MKKKYTRPSLETLALKPATIIATSIPVKSESDIEARSCEFLGGSIFEDNNDEEDETALKF